MKLHELQPPKGASKRKKIVGRGIGGKGGKTAGRGTKGQKARRQIPAGFEGGQLPLMQRVPKLKGFTNPFRVAYTPVNLDALVALGLSDVNPDVLVANGLAQKKDLVKILGRGTVASAINVSAHGFSESAKSAIESAGGTVTVLDKPFSVRPPAAGNQHQNR
ncbi:MAG: 50S ribosomal protein L15 [Acidobacteriota bacterium]|nr:50S ribosomal protein L15 [Acidobacteriota bacterium]MDE3044447.1 50S ribosomal protein L15 [Acidobacteriota bacterium]MDE3106751.1 50S ribosomal protein L15 [Acidobacteriota bacterium]MDE3222519.1 50S ribosomal protein L15 [Acidobacteriota bacterium]